MIGLGVRNGKIVEFQQVNEESILERTGEKIQVGEYVISDTEGHTIISAKEFEENIEIIDENINHGKYISGWVGYDVEYLKEGLAEAVSNTCWHDPDYVNPYKEETDENKTA